MVGSIIIEIVGDLLTIKLPGMYFFFLKNKTKCIRISFRLTAESDDGVSRQLILIRLVLCLKSFNTYLAV